MTATIHNPVETGYPVFLRLSNRPVLVVGGDETAVRKTHRLLQAGAQVDMVYSDAVATVRQWQMKASIRHVATRFEAGLIDGHCLIVVTQAEKVELESIVNLARERGLPLNVVDRSEACTALLPAVVDRSPVLIAIGTGGRAPELARIIRSRLEQLLPRSLGRLADLADSLRSGLRRRFDPPARRRFLAWLLDGAPARAIERGQFQQARSLAVARLNHAPNDLPGSVALVGAGPGDPELLTVRALHCIQNADVIVHDGLVDARILEHARRDAELIDVAKRPGNHQTSQDEIHRILVQQARRGRQVVRLKGGDPMVFGRGGEELEFLRQHGIDYQVVPGITAAVACGAYAGIPLTHRDHAQSVRLVTAHCRASIDRLDWSELAAERQTLAFYMAVGQLERVQQLLIEGGRSPSTPVALVENGTRPNQRVLTGTLVELVALARSNRLQAPAMLYVGSVAAFAGRLGWFGFDAAVPARQAART